jgi:hypothetical protein
MTLSPPGIQRRDAVTLPRSSIATLMLVAAFVALDSAGLRALYDGRSVMQSPVWEALLLGVPLIVVGLQFGLFRLLRSRDRECAFWMGFVLCGSVATATFIGTFAFFPESMNLIPCYCVAYYCELAGGILYRTLPAHILARAPFAWWFAVGILLLLPQLSIALAGGLLIRAAVARHWPRSVSAFQR